MKIGMMAQVLEGGKSGIGRYILDLVKPLDMLVDLDVVAFEEDLDLIQLQRGKKTLSQSSSRFFDIVGNNCRSFSQYDLVHFPCYRRMPLFIRAKTVVTVHDIGPILFPKKYGLTRYFYHFYLLKQTLKQCSKIIVPSYTTKEDLMRVCSIKEEKIRVIYSGIDTRVFCPQKMERKPFFVYVSRLEHPAKNHLGLIEAFELYRLNNPQSNHQLILAGADWQGAEVIKRRAAKSPYKDSILFTGFVSQEKIVELYRTCDCMVFPSFFEGFGFPVIEALACGAKVIVSNRASLKEMGKQASLELFDPENPQEIAQKMAIKQQSLYREAFLSQFNWEKAAKEVVEVYEEALRS